MSDFTFDVQGVPQVSRNLQKLGDDASEALFNALRRVTLELAGYVKEKKLTGQVLNVVTGRLRNSITPEVRKQPALLQGTVGTRVFYGRIHELGLGNQTEKRFLRDSLKENQTKILRTINSVLAEAIRKRNGK